jgi:hypothetical protein
MQQPPVVQQKQNGLKGSDITSEWESPFPKLQVPPLLSAASDASSGDGKQKAKKAGSEKAKATKKAEQKEVEQKEKVSLGEPVAQFTGARHLNVIG